jgi:hypothetical protein
MMNAQPYLREISLKQDRIASYDAYPFNLPAIRKLDQLVLHPDVTFIVGENLSGKSTLLEAIAAAWGYGPAVGVPTSGGCGLTGGWLFTRCKPRTRQLDDFLTGPAVGGQGFIPLFGNPIIGPGGGAAWSPGNGAALNLGVGTPGARGNFTGSWKLFDSGPTW